MLHTIPLPEEEGGGDWWHDHLVPDTQYYILQQLDPLALYLFSRTCKQVRNQCLSLMPLKLPNLWYVVAQYASTIRQVDWASKQAWSTIQSIKMSVTEQRLLLALAQNRNASAVFVADRLLKQSCFFLGEGHSAHIRLMTAIVNCRNCGFLVALYQVKPSLLQMGTAAPFECFMSSGTMEQVLWYQQATYGFMYTSIEVLRSSLTMAATGGNIPVMDWLWKMENVDFYSPWWEVLLYPPRNYEAVYQWLWAHPSLKMLDFVSFNHASYESKSEYTADAHRFYLEHQSKMLTTPDDVINNTT